jgi:tetratricopeptide (TPR) repeat protein
MPAKDLPLAERLLLVADDLRANRLAAALAALETPGRSPDLAFVGPLLRAWDQAGRNDPAAIATIGQISTTGPLGAFVPEQRALILLALRRGEEAEPLARRAIASAGGRETRVRLEMAEAYRAAGDNARALAMLDAPGRGLTVARARIAAGQSLGQRIDSPAAALAEVLLGLAISLNREDDQDLPIALTQVARLASPGNGESAIVLGLLLDQAGRSNDALAVFASVPRDDFLGGQARDARVRALIKASRNPEALALAQAAASERGADASDFTRLGDVDDALARHGDAATAYLRAIALTPTNGPGAADAWSGYLLAGSALEQAGRWPEARTAIEHGLKLAPENPLLLNFLGYAKLTHGEDVDAAEAMIRKASALRPSDASITDSLGWALYKRGKLPEAIATLQKAAVGDPAQSEIGEHLGDALYTAGRRFEARFAWRAALVTADNKSSARILSKIDFGLAPATAAP